MSIRFKDGGLFDRNENGKVDADGERADHILAMLWLSCASA
jgi:hypothetical protein